MWCCRFFDIERFKDIVFSKERAQYNKEFSKHNKDLDELYLFEYALKLGAVITYFLIQAIRYSQQKNALDNTSETDLILEWVENVLSPVSLVESFCSLRTVWKRMPIKSGKEKSITQSLSLFDLPRVKFQDLENIFKNSFGDLLFEDLEKIRQDSSGEITDKIEAAKNHATELMRLEQLEEKKRRLEKEDPDHVKCEGKPDPKWIMNRKEQLVSRCSKCSRWIPV